MGRDGPRIGGTQSATVAAYVRNDLLEKRRPPASLGPRLTVAKPIVWSSGPPQIKTLGPGDGYRHLTSTRRPALDPAPSGGWPGATNEDAGDMSSRRHAVARRNAERLGFAAWEGVGLWDRLAAKRYKSYGIQYLTNG